MKKIILNIIFIVLGIVFLLFQCLLKFHGILSWILITAGVLLIGVGIFYESKKSNKNLYGLIVDLLFHP